MEGCLFLHPKQAAERSVQPAVLQGQLSSHPHRPDARGRLVRLAVGRPVIHGCRIKQHEIGGSAHLQAADRQAKAGGRAGGHLVDGLRQGHHPLAYQGAQRLGKEYEEKFGPLGETTQDTSRWAWISDPWPWEKEGN